MALFVVRIFKSWGGRVADRRWVNNYEIDSGATLLGGLDAVVNDLVAAERIIHVPTVNFLSATISTWAPDSVPYNPDAFRTLELAGVGSRAAPAGDLLDSNVCYMVQFQCSTGRSGRRFYRGVLGEADVQIGGDGRFTLVPASALDNGGATFVAFQGALAPRLSAGAAAEKVVLVHSGGPSPSVVRGVSALKVSGVIANKRNHRYFDRASV